jgi:integrase
MKLKEYSGDNPYVFESPRKNHKTKPINSVKNSVRAIKKYSKVKDFRMHDIRRTLITYMAKLRVPREVLGRILNHKSLAKDTSVTAIYDRYSYGDEKREALEKWENYLLDILNKKD